MAISAMGKIVEQLRHAALLPEESTATDECLLADFVKRRDRAALDALVRRHGPMVFGVCRRMLHHHHDAEDVFQATFLVLVRKAHAIASPHLLANWLFGVAHHTALKARALAAKRRTSERTMSQIPETAADAPAGQETDAEELERLLDQELSRLPQKYRTPILLCDLGGKTHQEAADQLGWPIGTVSGRLARARALLAKRLRRLRPEVSAGAVASLLCHDAAPLSAGLVVSAVDAGCQWATGPALATGAVSASVAGLAQAMLKSMLLSNLKLVGALAVALLTVASAWGVQAGKQAERPGQPGPPAHTQEAEAKSEPLPDSKVATGIVTTTGYHPDDPVALLHLQYCRESSEKDLRSEKDRNAFHSAWERRFREILDSGAGRPDCRLAVLNELGALQGALNMPGQAMRTFEQMESEAEKAGNSHELHVARMNMNMFSRSVRESFERRRIIAERYVAALDRPSKEDPRTRNEPMRKGMQAAALYFTAELYMTEGLAHQKNSDPARRLVAERLLAKAEQQLQAAVDLGDVGNVGLSHRLFHLAKAQSAVGKKKEATATYDRLIRMDQKEFSKVWMEELKLLELAPVNTAEYRQELARVVAEHDRLGTVDKHVLQLKLQLANSYREAKEYKESNRWLTQLVGRLDTPNEDAIILELLANNHEALGERVRTVELWQEILTRYPASSAATVARVRLEGLGKVTKKQ